ncbi:hypothetical protein [Flammeovirga sp. EKP202]|uniref:hypothetical protein n=1 Tax=Flammeovirga sp. EKP202 TaxID=2770592 RepID=UPI00165F5354|nr:hypothetical protein [Flammeovirga sp. EKP202]MBD0401831.1 hypothetical protein [Flammeovirga sp. EKP202]
MKLFLLLLVLFSLARVTTSQAQFLPNIKKPSDMKRYQLEIDELKNRTTIFVLPSIYDEHHYYHILKEVWTFNEFKVIPASSYDPIKYGTPEYLVYHLVRESLKVKYDNSAVHEWFYTYFALHTFDEKFAEKYIRIHQKYARKDSYSTKINVLYDTNSKMWLKIFVGLENPSRLANKNILNTLYTQKCMVNFSLGHFKNQAQQLNLALENYNLYRRSLKDLSIVNKDIVNLKNTVLYVDEFVGVNNEKMYKTKKIGQLLKNYPYEYKIVKKKDIEALILEGKDIYYMTYIKQYTPEKMFCVTSAKTGKVVYQDVIVPKMYTRTHLKEKHLKKFINSLAKMNKKSLVK